MNYAKRNKLLSSSGLTTAVITIIVLRDSKDKNFVVRPDRKKYTTRVVGRRKTKWDNKRIEKEKKIAGGVKGQYPTPDDIKCTVACTQ
jgi:hypothetical protein